MIYFQTSYSKPGADQPLTHARIAHAGNWLTGGTIDATAVSDATIYSAEAANNTFPYERYKPFANSPAVWEYNHGSEATCDYCVIAGHTMGTTGNEFRVQYFDDPSWVDLIPYTTPTDDQPIYVIFAPTTATRWRITLRNGTLPEIASIKFGTSLQLPRPIYSGHIPLNFARRTELKTPLSETGVGLGRETRRLFYETEFPWDNIPYSWLDTNFEALQKAIEAEFFWIAWRPEDYPKAVGFGDTMNIPTAQPNGRRDLFTMSLSFRGFGYE